MHQRFSRLNCQKPENVKTHCNDLKNLFRFEFRRWMINE